ncbi:hypothetical protein [Methanoregula sp.]|uniref:hypothetical protein n=1 Tax=Methanoregula sp. TaxID=2052170 RepID=UPI003567F837
MTYLNWGCTPLTEECESCLDAICNACAEQFRKKTGNSGTPGGLDVVCEDSEEPDCDNCDLEKKPNCSTCEIILIICRNCNENKTCEFRIC